MAELIRPATSTAARLSKVTASTSLRTIRRYAAQIAEQFAPEKIILFGSYAYGIPNAESDVDLLVVMPTRSPMSQAVKIRTALPAPFALDLLVRSPQILAKQLTIGDWFITEIMTQGKVLYEKGNGSLGA